MQRRSTIAFLFVLGLTTTGCGHLVQQTVLLNRMRAQYYDMRKDGAKGFSCTAHPDWPLFVSSATGVASEAVLPDTPWHHYLQGVTLSVHSSLSGGTTVRWDEKAPPPADRTAPAQKLQGAFRQMLTGFFTAWRPSLTNTVLPALPVSEIRSTATGYSLTERDMQGRVSDVSLDKALRVTHASVHGPNLNVELDHVYTASPKGLLLTELDSTVKEPDGSILKSQMKTTYVDIGGFQLPATVQIDTGPTRVHMRLSDCVVEK